MLKHFDPNEAARTARHVRDRQKAFRASLQQQAEAKRLNLEMSRAYRDKFLADSCDYLKSEKDKTP